MKAVPGWKPVLGIIFAGLVCAFAQTGGHVAWTVTADPAAARPGGEVLLRLAGRIEPGWHLYSASTPNGIPTSFQAGPENIVESARLLQPPPKRAYDKNFQSDTETYEGDVTFLLDVRLKNDAPSGPVPLTLKGRYQTCNDTQCVPSRWQGTAQVTVDAAAAAAVPAIPAGYSEPQATAGPVPAQTGTPAPPPQALGAFLLVAFGFGLASIFTPCVFPMIPITMSYFLNRESGGRRDGVVQAVVFCLGIIVLFSGMGLAITAILGPFGVVQLGSNPWVNAFIATLFIVFGLSLLGAFEITIPSSILTRLNKGSEKGGFGGTLLMGLTFSLASFACVGPFVGTLLAASVGGGGARPLAGMVVFATGLALPFFLLALFPSYLKRLPRSGGWMSRVKVVMGFVILAASLKYLASLDQVLQWNVLTRDRFLAAWVVLFGMAGLYLLGFLRLEGIKAEDRLGMGRLLTGMGLVVFAISLLPGMFGGKLGDLDAYVPAGPLTSLVSGEAPASGGELVWMKNQYREALAKARAEGKLVFVNFTGYACANCHWMKANMFTRPEIAGLMQNFIAVDLYGDGTDAASEENQKLEMDKFHTVAEPFYAIMDADENVIATFPGLTKDSKEFAAFLQKGQQAPKSKTQESAKAAFPQVNSLDGPPLDTSALNGKIVVMNFWATWCVPCIQEIPSFNRLHQEYGSKGVAVVGVSMDDEGAERVKPFLKKHPIDYTVALGSEAVTRQFGLDELPVTVIFDRSGKQIKRFAGFLKEDELEAAIQQAL
jgi:thiol:disulfide interchange protein